MYNLQIHSAPYCNCVFQFVREILVIVATENIPLPSEYTCRDWYTSGHHSHKVWCDKTTRHVIPILKYWVHQLCSLQVTYFVAFGVVNLSPLTVTAIGFQQLVFHLCLFFQELQCSISKLAAIVVPWNCPPLNSCVPTTTSLIEALDTILYEVEDDCKRMTCEV